MGRDTTGGAGAIQSFILGKICDDYPEHCEVRPGGQVVVIPASQGRSGFSAGGRANHQRPQPPTPAAPWLLAPTPIPRFAPGHAWYGFDPAANGSRDPQAPYAGRRGGDFTGTLPMPAPGYGGGRALRGSRFAHRATS